jgi:translation elongation factor EF-Tu-like GTPase
MSCGRLCPTVINVRALVTFLPTREGGRASDVRGVYRPVHNFGARDNRELWFGQLMLTNDDKISPGEAREVLVQFNSEPALLTELKPGRVWRIQEGAQLVATAKVIEIIRHKTFA